MRESEGSTIVLVHVVQRGYTASVKRLYRLTSAKLRGTALRFHSNLAEAVDVLAERLPQGWVPLVPV